MLFEQMTLPLCEVFAAWPRGKTNMESISCCLLRDQAVQPIRRASLVLDKTTRVGGQALGGTGTKHTGLINGVLA